MIFETWTLFLLGLVLLVVIFRIKFSPQFLHGSNEFWLKQNVPILDIHKMAGFFERATFKISFREIDAKLYTELGDRPFGGFMELKTPVLYVKDPELIKRILVKDFEHFNVRKLLGVKHADPVISRTLTNTMGQEWRDLRLLWGPTFSSGKIRQMFTVMNACGRHLADLLEQKVRTADYYGTEGGEEGEENVINIQQWFGTFTLDVISTVGFFQAVKKWNGAKVSTFKKIANKFNHFDGTNIAKLIVHFLAPSFARIIRLSFFDPSHTKLFSSIIEQNIAERKNEKVIEEKGDKKKRQSSDFLDALLEAQASQLETGWWSQADKDGSNATNGIDNGDTFDEPKVKAPSVQLNDKMVIAQCYGFFNGGSDTVESTLTSAVYSLALNQDIQEKLYDQVNDLVQQNDGNEDLDYDTLHQFEYLEMFISETLRMYPPTAGTERTCTEDYTLPGTQVRLYKGCRVIISMASMHRDPKHFPDPDRFNPENFSLENKEKRHAYTYLPFGLGGRSCIGMRFAMIELKAVLTHLIHRFKIEPCSKTTIPLQLKKNCVLHTPLNGLYLKFTPRSTITNNNNVG